MKVLDLFSGIGGFSLGLQRAGMTTVAFCEIEPYAQAVLHKHWPGVPIYDDVRQLTAARLQADGITGIDVICGGFPCQPFSLAGRQRGTDDHRHLWPEMLRLVQELQPAWVIGENVAGFINMALDDVCLDLEHSGYEVQPIVIPACAVDARHRRDRVWIVAHSSCTGRRENSRGAHENEGKHEGWATTQADESNSDGERSGAGNVADTVDAGLPNRAGGGKVDECPWDGTPDNGSGESGGGYRWSSEPRVGRVAHGIPHRVDRLKGLGNAVVPQIPEIIGRAILAQENL